jgi:hypothetical protein
MARNIQARELRFHEVSAWRALTAANDYEY